MTTTIIDATFANPIFISTMIQENYNKYINNAHLSKKLSYTILNIDKYDNIIRNFMTNNGRPIPNDVFVRVSAGGSSLCILAHYYAVWKIKGRPITVGPSTNPPYYLLHKELAEFTGYCTWIDDITTPVDLEIDVSPNNPNGSVQPPTVRSEFVLLDSIYDFYNFTGEKTTVNPWVSWGNNFCMITSLSKFGLAGSRIGAYISANPEMIQYMQTFMSNSTLGTNTFSIETLKCVIKQIKMESRFTKKIYKKLQHRINTIRKIIPNNLIYSNNYVPFIFVKIPFTTFMELDILVRKGEEFDTTNEYSRIQLMISDADFKELVKRLKTLQFQR
jgi:hypothetical protein